MRLFRNHSFSKYTSQGDSWDNGRANGKPLTDSIKSFLSRLSSAMTSNFFRMRLGLLLGGLMLRLARSRCSGSHFSIGLVTAASSMQPSPSSSSSGSMLKTGSGMFSIINCCAVPATRPQKGRCHRDQFIGELI